MSAIAGMVLHDGGTLEERRLRRLIAATSHVRCDTLASWRAGPAGLLHFNLVTTPQARHEAMPLFDQSTGLTIALDGRLDNRPELLEKMRHTKGVDRDCGDGALLLALFKAYGTDCVHHLAGDYSLAVWQERTRQLFCARSPLGWRPFLWHNSPTHFGFATEPRTLIQGLGLETQLNEGAMGEFLSLRFTSPTETLWRDIYRLAPGAALLVENGRVRHWHWHQGPFPPSSDSDEESSERFCTLFDQALEACTRSDGEIAAHLSGGLDSSSVVCRAVELYRTGRLDRLVRPLSARFPGKAYDESEWSTAVEMHAGMESLIVLPRPYCWDKARSWCADTLHLPLRPNTLSTLVGSCAQMQVHGMRVLLTGEGGDDWLSGSHAHWPDLLRGGRWLQLWSETRAAHNAGYARRLKRLIFESAVPLVSPSRRARLQFPHLDFSYTAPAWLKPEWVAKIGLVERWRSYSAPLQLSTFAQQQRSSRYTVARTHVNIDNVLALAACSGIELRHPLHDLRLTRYLMGVPGDLLQRNGERKYLLRQAMRGTLPEKVRTRQGKAALSEPFVDAVERMFSTVAIKDLPCVRRGWVDPDYIVRSFEAHRAWHKRRGACDHRPHENLGAVWSAVAAGIWMEQALRQT